MTEATPPASEPDVPEKASEGEKAAPAPGVYRVQLWITRQPKARADLRRVWLANKLPLTVDTTDDGWTGALGTVTPDGYTIDVVSLLKPPTTLSVQVRSPCFKDRS